MSTQAATRAGDGAVKPDGMSLEDWLNRRIARFETRRYD